MGSIYQRGKTWWISYYHKGRQIRESAETDKKMVARQLLELREGEIAQGKLPSYQFDKTNFGSLAADLLTDYKINGKKSGDRVEEILRLHLKPFFDGKVREITTARVKDYIALRIDQGAKNATINRELAYLKRMLNLGAQQTPPKVDRVPHIPMLRENNVRKGFLEAEDFEDLMKFLPDYLKPLVLFAYQTGWRRSEITGLTWDRVDLSRGLVRLEAGETKNGEARTAFIGPDLLRAIKLQRRFGCPYVFHREGLKIADFSGSWKAACKKAGVPDRLFHDLRRTAVRNMVRAGTPERVAMMISGHKTRSVFDRYDIVSEEDLRLAAQRHEEYHLERTSTNPNTIAPKRKKGVTR
jgi:integrase